MSKTFAEEPLSISLHPTGTLAAVGFADKLRLLSLLVDDIVYMKEFPLRGCHEVAFSNGGQLFAAVQNNTIYIYSTYSFQAKATLKGHNNKVTGLQWISDDTRIISCGTDGAIYEWNLATGERVRENVKKSCAYTSIALSADDTTLYAVGLDKKMRVLENMEVVCELDAVNKAKLPTTYSKVGFEEESRMK